MTNLDSILKSRNITLPTKVRLVSSVQLLIRVPLYETLLIAALQASLSITNSRSSLRFMSIESVMPSNYLILCHSLLLLLSIFPRSGSFPMSQLFTGREVSTQQIVWHSALAPLHSVAFFAVWLVSTISSGQ